MRHAYMLGISYCCDKHDRPLICLRPLNECSGCGQLLSMYARILCTYVTVLDPASMQRACEAGLYAQEKTIFSLCLACGGSVHGGGWYILSVKPYCRFRKQDDDVQLLVDVVELQTVTGTVISRQESQPAGQKGRTMFDKDELRP